jgi:hypothetical protein
LKKKRQDKHNSLLTYVERASFVLGSVNITAKNSKANAFLLLLLMLHYLLVLVACLRVMMGRRRLLWLLLLLLTLLSLPSMAAAARNKRGRTIDDPPKQPEDPCAEVPAVCRTNVNGARQIGPQINSMGQRVRGLDKGKRKSNVNGVRWLIMQPVQHPTTTFQVNLSMLLQPHLQPPHLQTLLLHAHLQLRYL